MRPHEARGELSAEVVELLRSAPELVVHGAEAGTLARVGVADARVAALSRREGVVAGATDGLGVLITGVTVAGVLAVAVSAHSSGTISGVWVATLGLLALASFESVAALPQASRELSSTLAAGRRVLELTDRRPRVTEPETALAPPSLQPRLALEGVTAGYGDEPSVLHDSASCSTRAVGLRSWGRAARGRPRSSTCCCASSIPARARC